MEQIGTDVQLRAPRAAAVAGILFAVLLTTITVLMWEAVPADPAAALQVSEFTLSTIATALTLVPFAGVAFLWFIGVIRNHVGAYEDKLFATVYLGSGLLFLAMYFASTAIAGAMLTMIRTDPSFAASATYTLGRHITALLVQTFAMKMAGLFIMSTSMVSLRTRIVPRPLAALSLALALTLMFASSVDRRFTLLFPVWVISMSVYILVSNLRRDGNAAL